MKNKLLALFVALILAINLQSQSTTPGDFFTKYEIKTLSSSDYWMQAKTARNELLKVELNGWDLNLFQVDLYASTFSSTTDQGLVNNRISQFPVPMNGYTDEGGRVSITFGKEFVYGFIEKGNETFYIEPARYYQENAKRDQFIFYKVSDIIYQGPKTCGYTNEQNRIRKIDTQGQQRSTGLCYDIEYGICADYSMFDKYGTVADVDAQVIGVTNNVNTNYDDEFDDQMSFVVTGIHTITTMGGDPWSASTDPDILLPSFAAWAEINLNTAPINIPHDVASLWTDRDFDGSTIGLAYTPGACNSGSKYNILQDFNSNADQLRVLTAHELGHNFDAGHDPGPLVYIMSPSVTNTVAWSALSISTIDAYVDAQSCFSFCTGLVQANFDAATSIAGEAGNSGTGGPCLEPYVDIKRSISLTNLPAASATINVAVDGSGSATVNYDFELITTTVTFTPTGSLSQDVTIRIYDDLVEEVAETIVLNISTTSQDITIGFVDQHTITLSAVGDVVASDCCSMGSEITSGTYNYNLPTIFSGNSENAKTRVLYLAADLLADGLTAGYLDRFSLFVVTKNSNAPFENFRVGMLNVTDNNFIGVPWYNTEEVFNEDYTTSGGSWNDFEFSSLFYWDGTSNLYVDLCFNNSATVGQDVIRGSMASGDFLQFRTSATTPGCDLNTGGIGFFTVPVNPQCKFRQIDGAEIATSAGSTSGGRLRSGDIAHFYSASDQVICSVKNLGAIDMDCIDVTINTAGAGQQNLPFGADQYSAKTIQVDADNDAYYELTIYYTDGELSTWGAGATDLNIIQSTVPIASTTAANSEVRFTSDLLVDIGNGDGDGYRTTAYGNGYFALTNGTTNRSLSSLDQANFVVEEDGFGILLKNNLGTQYLVTADASGNLSTSLNNAASANQDFSDCDFIIVGTGSGLILNGLSANPVMLNVDNTGVIQTQVLGTVPATSARLTEGHLGVSDSAGGVVFKNGNGDCWKMIIDDSGNLFTYQVGCGNY